MTRQEANLELAYKLLDLIDTHPDLRFSQILDVFGFVKAQRPVKDRGRISWQNEFNMEGEDLLKRVKQRIEDIEEQNDS